MSNPDMWLNDLNIHGLIYDMVPNDLAVCIQVVNKIP